MSLQLWSWVKSIARFSISKDISITKGILFLKYKSNSILEVWISFQSLQEMNFYYLQKPSKYDLCGLLFLQNVYLYSTLKTIYIFISKCNLNWHLDNQIQFESRIFFRDEWSVHLKTSCLTTSFAEEEEKKCPLVR